MRHLSKCVALASVSSLLLVAACAHYPDVRPSADGLHKVVIMTEDKDGGYRLAKSQADDYCDESEKKPLVVTEDTAFVGSGSEDDYNRNKAIAKAVQVAGAGVTVLGGKKERPVGAAVGLGGTAGDAMLGNGYRYTMTFRCEK